MGYCLYGNDIDDSTSPLEAGLGWITKLSKPQFSGRAAIEKKKSEGITKKLVGIELTEKGIPRHGYEITDKDGKQIGHVTSGTQAPLLQKAIAMGYVDMEHSKIDTPVFIKIREKLVAAKIVKMPFE